MATNRYLNRIIVSLGTLAGFSFGVIRAQESCDNGIVMNASGINGQITICTAIAKQMPTLARQLTDIKAALADQKSQLAELNRLIHGMNSVSRKLGLQRQTELLENIAQRLAPPKDGTGAASAAQVSALADRFEALQDRMLNVLSDEATAKKAQAALQGPAGDAIARLDLDKAESMLSDIKKELAAIHTDVNEINERTQDIQQSIQSQRIEPAQLQAALMVADMNVLRLATPASVEPTAIGGLLGRRLEDGTSVALHFFEASADVPAAVDWFRAYLKAGLNPNLTVPSPYYDREAILAEALRARNPGMIRTLLVSGANPHPYQELEGTAYPSTRFMFPLASILKDDRYDLQEKKALAEPFFKAGMIMPQVIPEGNNWEPIMYAAKEAQQAAKNALGDDIVTSRPLCAESEYPICKNASTRSGEDWCRTIARIPKRMAWDLTGSYQFVGKVDLLYVLGIGTNEIYFLGVTPPHRQEYVLVKVSKDASNWTIFQYGGHESGFGQCKEEKNFTPPQCWRSIPLTRIAGTNQLRVSGGGPTFVLEDGDCDASGGVDR